ncbi:MAG: aminopeptidase P family protein, partial [Microbacterium sp.]|nr:aminopeptidase P family protein [Microbacterium sp.]
MSATSETPSASVDEAAAAAATAANANRRQPYPGGFLETISSGWAERPDTTPPQRPQASYAAARRDAVSAAFPGRR